MNRLLLPLFLLMIPNTHGDEESLPTWDIKPVQGKWGEGWQREVPLGKGVERLNDEFPLSDQYNTGEWKLDRSYSDEFDGSALNLERWLPHNHVWGGRAPAAFLPRNVEVADGRLKLSIRREPGLRGEIHGTKYRDWSSATVQSLVPLRYGYLEVRAKAAIGSSAFWLFAHTEKGGERSKLEIDVYELGGRRPGWATIYNMNTWIFADRGIEKRKGASLGEQNGGKWESGINFADGFHVFGLKWGPELISWYVDGVKVREMPNRVFHTPLHILLDTETMPQWFGMPTDAELEHQHEVDYIRVWKNQSMDQGWAGHKMRFPLPERNMLKDFVEGLERRLTQ